MAELFAAHRALSFSVGNTMLETIIAESMPALGYDGVFLFLVANAA